MALEHASPHLANCDCPFCQPPRLEEQKNPFETAVVAMPRERRDSYETASDSDNDRTKKDERIRQAPYLPRIQVWARDSGPYTLRVGNQWFHCDDLLINGGEYRQQVRKAATSQPPRPAQTSAPSGAAPAAKRKPLSRQQSYQRTRPNDAPPTSRPTAALARQPSREQVSRPTGYGSQALPDPRRKPAAKKPVAQPVDTLPSAMKSDVNASTAATSGQLVPYKPPPSDPVSARQPPRQARPARPGRALSRGNSYQIPVRQAGRKAVRFAPLPG